MPIFLIERNFAQRIQLDQPGVSHILDVEKEVGINWLFSFLTTDRKKTYCVYEAPNAEAIRESARRLNEPADVIVELSAILPGGMGGDTLAATLPSTLSGLVQSYPPAPDGEGTS